MGGQLDELLASLAARCRMFAYYFRFVFLFNVWWVTNKYDSIKSYYWNRPEQSGFYARQHAIIARIYYRPSVCPSSRLSDGWIIQKRLKLGL